MNAIRLTAPEIPNLPAELQRLLRQIPRGKVTTYGTLATALGDVKAARWVGEYLVDHPHRARCPCHRVVLRSGHVGQFITRNPDEKIARLATDGIVVNDGQVRLPEFGFDRFRTSAPLQMLRDFQETLADRNEFPPLPKVPDFVGGLDVSYDRDGWAWGCYVLVRRASGEAVWSCVLRRPSPFPYIPGFLTFREAPVHLELLQQARQADRLAKVVLVDGNGILHHRRAGVATYVGLVSGTVTIGIGKKLLCGHVDLTGMTKNESRPVTFQERLVGAAVKPGERSKPIFVSPGAGIDVESSVRVVQQCLRKHRLPEPIYLADRLSREAACESATPCASLTHEPGS